MRIDDFLKETGWTDASDEVYSFVQYYRDPKTGEIQDVGYASEIAAGRYLIDHGWGFQYCSNRAETGGAKRHWGWMHPDPAIVDAHGGMSIEVAFEFARREALART